MKKSIIRSLILEKVNYIIKSSLEGDYVENGGEYAINGGYPNGGYNSIFSNRLSSLLTNIADLEGRGKTSREGIKRAQQYLAEKGVDLESRWNAFEKRYVDMTPHQRKLLGYTKETCIPNQVGVPMFRIGDYLENVGVIVYKDGEEIKPLIEVRNTVKSIAGDYGDSPTECVNQIYRDEDGVYRNGKGGNPIKADFYSIDDFVEKYGE